MLTIMAISLINILFDTGVAAFYMLCNPYNISPPVLGFNQF
jgi:hypothetical protein